MKLKWLALLVCGNGLLEGNFACLDAQDNGSATAATVTPNQPQTVPINFQVLQTSKINLGNRSAVYNLVAPPLLPANPAPNPPSPPTPLTAQQIQAFQQLHPPPKKNVLVVLTAIVYDREVTRLSWSDENGAHSAYSNLDFNYLSGVGALETADTSYILFIGLGDDTRAAAATQNIQVPALSQFDPTHSQYVIVQDGSNSPTEESTKGIDDIHAYFDANKQQLIDGYNQRVADQQARAQWLLIHPPIPQDTVINFWPVNSTNYQTAPQGAQP